MRFIVLINLLMMLIHTTGLTETATTGNLLPNAGTGQTSVQHDNSTVDGLIVLLVLLLMVSLILVVITMS